MTVSLRSNQALQASTLIGRAVYVPTNHIVFRNDDAISVLVFLKEDCSRVVIFLESETGDTVLQKEIGDQRAGDVHIEFDPLDGHEVNLGNGQYLLRAEADFEKSREMVPTYMKAIVESVKLSGEDHEPVLNLTNNKSIALSRVRIIL